MKKLIIQALSFFGISGLGWIIDMVIYTLLTSVINFDTIYSNIISSCVAVTIVYIFSTRKIFKNESKNLNLTKKYIVYVVYQIIAITLFSILLGKINGLVLLIDYEIVKNFSKIIAKIIVTPFTMITNFIFMKVLIEKI